MAHKVIIHIGLHKTATGVLQRQFFPACEEANILTTAQPEFKSFIELVTRKDPIYFDSEQALNLIKPLLSNTKINVLSNESLSCLPFSGIIEAGLDHRAPIIENLSRVFPDAKILLVIRKQDGFAKSLYRQYLKSGGTRTIQRFYSEPGSGHPALVQTDRFLYRKYIDHLYEKFKGDVKVLPYELFVKNQKSFLNDLAAFVGITKVPEISLRSENVSTLSPLMMQVSRLLNHFFRSHLNPAGIIPGYMGVRHGIRARISIGQLIHEKWPFKYTGKNNLGDGVKVVDRIFQLAKEDNFELDKKYSLNLKAFDYYQ